MLYLPINKTKIYLIILCGLILFHISFISSKSYSSNLDEYKIINVTEEQYQSCLNSLTFIGSKTEFIANTKIKCLFNLPENFLMLIFLGYFIIALAFILSFKFNIKASYDGNK